MAQTRVTRELPNLVNGVSQQHPQFRLPSQADIVENFLPSLVHGLRTRFPVTHVAKLSDSFSATTPLKTHVVPRGDSPHQFLMFANNGVSRITKDGALLSLSLGTGAAAYITTNDPEHDIVTKTIADHTFILNKRKVTALKSTKSPARACAAMVFVKVANYQTTYNLTIDGVTATHTTPDGVGTEANPPDVISTHDIARALVEGATWPDGISINSGTISAIKSVIYILCPTQEILSKISISDSRGNTQMFLITDKVQHYSDLPTMAKHNFITKVSGEHSTNAKDEEDDYYVTFIKDCPDSDIGPGVWRECAAPDMQHTINETTMPFAVRIENNAASVIPMEWVARQVGDEVTNPTPSFINQSITDIFFHRNRLGFIAGDNVILSQAGDFLNFWAMTARTITDGDPIDYSASQEEVHRLLYAVPFHEELLLFSEKTQFALSGGDILSPNTAVVKNIASYQIRQRIRPVTGAKTLFFCSDEEAGAVGTRMKEMYVDVDSEVYEASDITAHVPKFVPVSIRKIVSNAGKSLVFALPQAGNEIYVYKYFWNGKEKLQSAWFRYSLPPGCTCASIETHENELYMFNVYDDKLYLETMSLDYDKPFEADTYPICLDRLLTQGNVTTSYNATTGKTTFTLPYPVEVYQYKIIETNSGLSIPILEDESTATTLVVLGDYSSTPLSFGYPYTATYQFSDQYPKRLVDDNNPLTTGRLQYRCWKISYGLSGEFRIDVLPKMDKDTIETTNPPISAARVGTTKLGIGSAVLKDGLVRIGVYANARDVKIRVTTTSHLPITLVSAAWEGVFQTNAGRLT